jgi:predicted lipoprotein
MKSNELRLGNYIMYSDGGEIGQVIEIDRYGQVAIDLDCELMDLRKYYSPVILTPEILEKCGFVVDGNFDNHSVDYHRLGSIHLQMMNYDGHECYYTWRDNVIQDKLGDKKQHSLQVQHLHQLQNLYFALTQTELTIQL